MESLIFQLFSDVPVATDKRADDPDMATPLRIAATNGILQNRKQEGVLEKKEVRQSEINEQLGQFISSSLAVARQLLKER
jgi:hypothetical protein